MDTNHNNNNQNYGGYYPESSNLSNASSFDFTFWIFRLLKYWYLFVIALIISLSLAFLKNKSWTPTYRTTSTILIEENKNSSFNDLTSGYYVKEGLRNINNQMIMYGSYDLVSKSVHKLDVTTDIYKKQRFKDVSMYKRSPISITGSYVSDNAFPLEFSIKGIDENFYQISFDGNDRISAFQIKGEYGKSLQYVLFFIEVNKTDLFPALTAYDLSFRFFSEQQQIADYHSRLSYRFLMEGASVMEISLNGKVADRDVDFMDILNQEFFDENLRRKNLNAERAIQFISDQLLIIKDSINSSEYKLNAYQMQSGLYSQDKSMRTNTELDGLDKTRAELRLRKEYTNFLIGYLKKENELLVAPSAMGIQDPALSALVAKYNDISYSLKGLGPESPIYKRYKTQLEDTKANLNEAIDAMNSSIRIEENNLSQRYSKLMGEVASLPEKERKLLTHERDFKINDSYNTYLLQRRIESQIQLASNTPDNLVLDKPRTIAVINIADKSNTYLLFTVIGLLLAFVFVFCKEFLFKFSIQSRDEIERISQLPILGTVERSTKKVPVVVKMFPRSSFAENFRSLRSRMEYIARREAPILMLITSTEPQDGKTFIVCNLASTYQLTGKKTLVVDFDLRRPALSKMMGFSKEKGISNYLIGQSKLEDIIIRHPEYDFDVLPAGTVPPNPSELIHSEKTKELLQKLNKEYDYILLDCSPVGLVSDAHFLAKQSDVVLYVVRNEKTNRNFFKYTIAELKEDLLETNIAIIYNDVNLKGNYYGGRKYYGRSPYYSKHDSYYHNEEEQSKEKEGQ